MAIVVCGRRHSPALREIVEAADPVTELRPCLEARVDHGHTHAITRWRLYGETELSAKRRISRGRLLCDHDRIHRDGLHKWKTRETCERGDWHASRQRIDDLMTAKHRMAIGLQRVCQRACVARRRADDALRGGVTGSAACPGA